MKDQYHRRCERIKRPPVADDAASTVLTFVSAVLGQLSDRLNFLCCAKKMRRPCGREQRTIDHVLCTARDNYV